MFEKEQYQVLGFSKGTTKKGDKFTKLALAFKSPFPNFVGFDVESHFIYEDLDINVDDYVYLDYGRRQDGKAYVRGVTLVE